MEAVSESFRHFLEKGTSRSTEKLKPLHGFFAKDLASRLGSDYEIVSQGYGDDKEANIKGRYIDKKVDITIKRDNKTIAGIAVKFIMQNYAQNSNNYFENMLGETANIRCANCPYFQIFIIPNKLPYYNRAGNITRWETFTEHNSEKYIILSSDPADKYWHTPNKMLLVILDMEEVPNSINNKYAYLDYYKHHFKGFKFADSHMEPKQTVILNDYSEFMDKVYHAIMAL